VPLNRPRQRTSAQAVPVLLICAGFVLALTAPASASSAKGSSGSFTFTGSVSGTLKVPAGVMPGGLTSCAISPSQNGTDVITWDTAKLKISGKTKKLTYVELQIEVSKFGGTTSMVQQNGTSKGAVFLSTGAPYQWVTNSGSLATAKGGKSGSVDGSMSVPAGGNHPGTVKIKGSWAGCTKISE
jgi:hypothetical protein